MKKYIFWTWKIRFPEYMFIEILHIRTGQYTNFHSFETWSRKAAWIKCLFCRQRVKFCGHLPN